MSELATFAAGCFWGVEELYRQLPGVLSTRVGYTGGVVVKPTYEDVCTGTTHHAETVEITFDPGKVPYEKLLELFWENHNPTTIDRQGPDVGSQYRSAIFFHSAAQEEKAKISKENLVASGKWPDPIVTEIVAAEMFYPAEHYHQQYLAKRGLGSCHI